MIPRSPALGVSALALLALASLAFAACGGQPGGVSATQSGGTWTTFRSSPTYRFTIGYDPRLFNSATSLDQSDFPAGGFPPLNWALWPKSLGATQPDNPDASVTLTTTNWWQLGNLTRAQLIKGNVWSLRWNLSPSPVASTNDSVGADVPSHPSPSPTRRSVRGTFDKPLVGGVPGYRVRFTDNGWRNVYEYCVRGHYEYLLQLSCRESLWPRLHGPLLAALDSFRVK